MRKYIIRDSESNNTVIFADSLDEAISMLKKMSAKDNADEKEIEEELAFNGVKCKVLQQHPGNEFRIDCKSESDTDKAMKVIEANDGRCERINKTSIRMFRDSTIKDSNIEVRVG